MKQIKGLLWGAIIIILGIIWGINESGVANVDIFFDGWWTLFIIIPSFIGLFTDKNKLGSIIGLLVGGLLLASNYVDMSKYENYIFPCVVVIIGVIVITRAFAPNKRIKNDDEFNSRYVSASGQSAGKVEDYYATFSGENIVFTDEFHGGNFTATFGGMKIDLRNARIYNNAVINANTTFGGIDILVPRGVRVVSKSKSLFGGVSDKTDKNLPPEMVTIIVNSQNLFGGTDIK